MDQGLPPRPLLGAVERVIVSFKSPLMMTSASHPPPPARKFRPCSIYSWDLLRAKAFNSL